MLLKDFVEQSRKELREIYPEREAGAIASLLCTDILGVQPYTHITEPLTVLTSAVEASALDALRRLKNNEPVQYVLGYTWFCDNRFKVNPSVLIPRPETARLCLQAVEEAEKLKHTRILDMCTGSGCIAWTLASRLPDADIVAVDISSDALAVAASQEVPVRKAPSFVRADIFDDEAVDAVAGDGFDMIISNPPYIMESEKRDMLSNVLDYEPSLALFVPDDNPLVFYEALAGICKRHIHTGGVGFFEINGRLGDSVAALFRDNGLRNVTVIDDQFGKNRYLRCVR